MFELIVMVLLSGAAGISAGFWFKAVSAGLTVFFTLLTLAYAVDPKQG